MSTGLVSLFEVEKQSHFFEPRLMNSFSARLCQLEQFLKMTSIERSWVKPLTIGKRRGKNVKKNVGKHRRCTKSVLNAVMLIRQMFLKDVKNGTTKSIMMESTIPSDGLVCPGKAYNVT